MKIKSITINSILNTLRTLMTLVFPLITFPYALHIFGAEKIGTYSFSKSIVNYFVLLAGLGIGRYAAREGSRMRDNKLKFSFFANQMLTLNLISTIISYILLFIIITIFEDLLDYRRIILIQSSIIIFTTLGMDWVNTCFEEYAYITVRTLIFQILSIFLLFIFVRNENDLINYVWVCLISSVGTNILNIFHIRKFFKIKLTLRGIRKHLPPVFLLFASTIASTIYVNSDATMLGLFFNDYTVGIYDVSTKIYSIIQQVLSASILVTLPRISNLYANNMIEVCKPLINKVFNYLIIIIIPVVIGLIGLSDKIIEIIAGTQFYESNIPLKVLSLSLFFSIFGIFYTNTLLLPLKKEKEITIIMIIAAIVNFLTNFIFIPILGCVGAAITTVIAELIVLILQVIVIRNDRKLKNFLIVENFKSVLIGSCFIIIIISIYNFIGFNSSISFIIMILVSILGYFFMLIYYKNRFVINFIGHILEKYNN